MNIGFALSGGVAWGLANVGVLEYMEEQGVKPSCISGSSMGAIVGAVAAMGYSSTAMRDVVSRIRVSNMIKSSDRFWKDGMHGGFFEQQLHDLLYPLLGDATIGDCHIPFLCIAGHIKQPLVWHKLLTGGMTEQAYSSVERFIFPPDTLLMDALRATSALPVIFSPVRIGEYEYIDLCTFGAVPVRSMRAEMHPDVVIATNTTPSYDALRYFPHPPVRSFIHAAKESLQESLAQADVVITPNLIASPWRFDKGAQFIEEGKKATEKKWEEIKRAITI